MADSFPSFCSKCGCSLSSTFLFCPKCGAKTTTSRASSPGEQKFSLPKFKEFKAKKENERSSFSVRGKTPAKKRKVADEVVTIHVGVINEEGNPKRAATIPLKIGSRASADDIRTAAVKKHTDFNQRFDDKATYKLVFRDGKEVKFIPGTDEEPFVLRRYKEESGFGYARIVLFLAALEHESDDIQLEVKNEDSEHDEMLSISSDEELMKPTVATLPSRSIAMPPVTNTAAGPSGLQVDCPTCWNSFAITEIESHADMCAQKVADFSDPDEKEENSTVPTPEKGNLLLCCFNSSDLMIIVVLIFKSWDVHFLENLKFNFESFRLYSLICFRKL